MPHPPMNTAMPPLGLPSNSNNLGLRSSGRGGESSPATALADLPTDHSYLDIPAFLRRQAD